MKTSWDFTNSITKEVVEKEREIIKAKALAFREKWLNNQKYLINTKILKEVLDDYNEWNSHYAGGGLSNYLISLSTSINQLDPNLKALENKQNDFSIEMSNLIRFFPLSLTKLSSRLQQKCLKDIHLSVYKHFLELIFAESKHTLTESEEKILSMNSQTSYSNWVDMTSKLLSKEERYITINKEKRLYDFNTLLSLTTHIDEKIRNEAAQYINEIVEKYADVATEEINSVLKYKQTIDTLRNFDFPDTSRHMQDDIDTNIVKVLLSSVQKFNSIAHELYKIKAQLLKKDKLLYHERNIPYEKSEKKYSFEETVKLIQNVFGNLDKEFLAITNTFLDNGQVDVFPKKGKRGGAFCAHYLINMPTYIMLNHTDKLQDVLTFAHELGHGINNELIKQKQMALNFGTPTSTAEVASTFMEDFVLEELLKTANDEEKIAILMQRLSDDVSSIQRQVACYLFEQDLHNEFRKSGYLSKETISNLFVIRMNEYMGEYVEQTSGCEYWWVYWSHIRTYFYVYSYASGLLISKSLQAMVRQNKNNIEKVKIFLSAGTSIAPKELFNSMEIDITNKEFWELGLKNIQSQLQTLKTLLKI